MNKDIRIEVKGVEESAMEAVRAWERAEQGIAPEEPVDCLYFQSLETLLSVLTIRRLLRAWSKKTNIPPNTREYSQSIDLKGFPVLSCVGSYRPFFAVSYKPWAQFRAQGTVLSKYIDPPPLNCSSWRSRSGVLPLWHCTAQRRTS